MWPVLSCAHFLCNRARELLECDALEALDVAVLVEIAHHVHRRALFVYELEQLAFIAHLPLFADSLLLCRLPLSLCRSSHSANFLCVSLSATSLAERLVSASASASMSSLASASACSSFSFIYNGGIWTTRNFSKSDSSVVLALHSSRPSWTRGRIIGS